MRAFRPRREQNDLLGISAERIADIAQVHVTTARRWKRGEEPPHAAKILITLLTSGDLSVLHPGWAGWFFRNGELIAPDGVTYNPGQIMSTRYWQQLARHYQAKQRLPQQADWIDSEWVEAREEKEPASG